MSTRNPTPVRVGVRGEMHGWQFTVVGRVVLGVTIEGETFYWNEFNLAGDRGNSGTLVFEETEHGPEWKLFRDFTPNQPMTAAAAKAKRVGDSVNLDGTPTRVTLTGESRVYHIEGTAPEGVEVGDIAHYFNADTGKRMLVASWTGDEIEFYEGEDVPPALVANAFGLPATHSALGARVGSGSSSGSSKAAKIVILILAILFAAVIAIVFGSKRGSRAYNAAPARPPPPALQLAVGAQGPLGAEVFTITGAATVELARVSGVHHRREYQLADSGAEPRLLVQGLTGQPKEWHLLQPTAVTPPLEPYAAAGLRKGASINTGPVPARVTELFRAKTIAREANAAALPEVNAIRYGFLARTAAGWTVARWDETGVQVHHAIQYAESDVIAAFVVPEARK